MATVSLIMPTVDWGLVFSLCFRAARMALGSTDELLVVFDGVPPPPPAWLQESGAVLLQTGSRCGPAAARNLGAVHARHPILVFVDADVELHSDSLEIIRARFSADPSLSALFGSYDDTPSSPGVVSRFRNLLHHYTHVSHAGPASTFWAGCGAVRQDSFIELGGFDAKAYREPCIEDIEFGLRLHESGGRILLDPSIQGKHHKRWTLGLMVRTDIWQRAIPWSRLLFERQRLPTTLNLSFSARLSAAASLLILIALISLTISPSWICATWLLAACLALILLINRSFLALLWRQGGFPLAVGGTALFILYLIYSSLSFGAVAFAEKAASPFQAPLWLRSRPNLQRGLCLAGIALLALMATAAIVRGLVLLGLADSGKDLFQRFDEWRLFSDQIYPSRRLADPDARALPYFRTTVYLPWALPLFGLFFAGGGMVQGKVLISLFSFAALVLMAAIGWRWMRPLGRRAAWLGLLIPLAIAGNGNALAHGQFSIICMGLVSLQWLLLARRRALSGGLCWAVAMLKPQISIFFVLPMLSRRHWLGLLSGAALLLALSFLAFFYTKTNPVEWIVSWFRVLPAFVSAGHQNVLASFVALGGDLKRLAVFCMVVSVPTLGVLIVRLRRSSRFGSFFAKALQMFNNQSVELAGFCGLAGWVGFYHLSYDAIMLFPALLAAWRASLQCPRWGNMMFTLLLSFSSFTPLRVQEVIPGMPLLQMLTWCLTGIWLLWKLLGSPSIAQLRQCSSGCSSPFSRQLA